jgi:carboxypeptidase C (cathepsin A)
MNGVCGNDTSIGPKTIVTAGDGSFPAVPARLEENPDSWIRFTDLVFIDPVDTGYSRMLPGPDGKPRDGKPYHGVAGDLDAIAVFIRQWLTDNNRWGSPKAIAGESYGGQRVAALSRILAEQYAINLNWAVMLSPAFYLELSDPHYSLVAPMTLLPSQAAIAAHHGLSTIKNEPAAIKAVEDYAMTPYLAGLATQGRASPEEQATFHAKVGGLIGIEPALVANHRGRISEVVFAANLLGKKGQVIDTYDGTQASDNPTPEKKDELGAFDRSLNILSGVLLAFFTDNVRKDLGYVSDRPYIPLNLPVNMSWDRSAKLGGPDDLAIALAQNHDLKALVLHGYHDLNANYLMSRYALEQTVRGAETRKRLFFGTYPGGHMFHLRKKSRAEMAADVRGSTKRHPEDDSTPGLVEASPVPAPRSLRRAPAQPLRFQGGGRMWPRRFAARMIQMETLPHTSKGTADPSTPKLPPVSQSGPCRVDLKKPLGGALPETMPEYTEPCV